MGPKKDTSTPTIDELVIALKDERVLEALGTVLESKLQTFVAMKLKADNSNLTRKVTQLESALTGAKRKIDALGAYTRPTILSLLAFRSQIMLIVHLLMEVTSH